MKTRDIKVGMKVVVSRNASNIMKRAGLGHPDMSRYDRRVGVVVSLRYMGSIGCTCIRFDGIDSNTWYYKSSCFNPIEEGTKTKGVGKRKKSSVTVAKAKVAAIESPKIRIGKGAIYSYIGDDSDLYILAQVDDHYVNLISLADGNRWKASPSKVKDITDIKPIEIADCTDGLKLAYLSHEDMIAGKKVAPIARKVRYITTSEGTYTSKEEFEAMWKYLSYEFVEFV